MNIFLLSLNPYICALWHCDQHCIKMILEYAQVLSTAHRVLDGKLTTEKTANGRSIKRYKFLSYDDRENLLYKSTHVNHPSAIWARESDANYRWLYNLFCCLCDEYTKRYKKVHKSDTKLREFLKNEPMYIDEGPLTPIPQAMPDEYKVENDPILAYRIFYVYSKSRFAEWKHTEIPWWYKNYNICNV